MVSGFELSRLDANFKALCLFHPEPIHSCVLNI